MSIEKFDGMEWNGNGMEMEPFGMKWKVDLYPNPNEP